MSIVAFDKSVKGKASNIQIELTCCLLFMLVTFFTVVV